MNNLLEQQVVYYNLIRELANINICQCPQCSGIVLTPNNEGELTCPHCKTTDDISHFPDLYY